MTKRVNVISVMEISKCSDVFALHSYKTLSHFHLYNLHEAL